VPFERTLGARARAALTPLEEPVPSSRMLVRGGYGTTRLGHMRACANRQQIWVARLATEATARIGHRPPGPDQDHKKSFRTALRQTSRPTSTSARQNHDPLQVQSHQQHQALRAASRRGDKYQIWSPPSGTSPGQSPGLVDRCSSGSQCDQLVSYLALSRLASRALRDGQSISLPISVPAS
jgi:hypothetical protein